MLRRLFLQFLALLAPLALILGIYLGGHPDMLPGPVRDAFVGDGPGQIYDEAIDIIAEDFYRPVEREKLLNSSLQSAVESLEDDFSHYFDPESYGAFRETTTGEFEGVGMTVEEVPRGLEVLTVFEDGPAERAGIRRGDTIVAVDGKSLRGRSSEVGTAMIKGKAGTQVRLTIVSKGRRRTETVTREQVSVPVVEARLEREDGRKVAYVALTSFTAGAHGELRQRLRRLIDRGAKSVVLDLRDNGGGLLNEAVLVASIFIPEGTIVTTRGRSRPPRTFEASGKSIDTKIPVAVLVNGRSASASEIVTGALQDRDRAVIIGERTFGKGVFQEIKELPNGGALDLTVGEYFTPKGRNLGPSKGRRGIEPDVNALDRAATPDRDEALDVALRAVSRKAA